MRVAAVIPARYESTRLPGKPLADICGRPMVWWVHRQVCRAPGIDEACVATDSVEVAEACGEYGIPVVMTSEGCKTSTERVLEASASIDADVYVCVNGDEPLIDPEAVAAVVPGSLEGFFAANLMTEVRSPAEAVDGSNIKVVTDRSGNALFMSRAPIPHPKASLGFAYRKHVGVLAYTREALRSFAEAPRGANELVEDVNELRFIENGMPLRMVEVASDSLSVDTQKDLDLVRSVIEERIAKGEITL
ncbi:MAG: 3-deoxy-manno-octulosonate cytidylyltransferase [Eggerthellaceae bacterium]|nr:3-deoxy-manno-octulosonate cytidylyltransferase [Eggerthellaceae bacterium]